MSILTLSGSPALGDAEWALDAEVDRSSYTVLCKFPSRLIKDVGSNIQIQVLGPAAGGTLSATYISGVAASGNAYDADTTPTAITWNSGAASLTMSALTLYSSDVIAFAFNGAPFIIGFNVGASTKAIRGYLPRVVTFYHSALAEADDTTRTTGYSSSLNSVAFLTDIRLT